MPTVPPHGLLDREFSRASVREQVEAANPMLQEIVNYGVAVFARCERTSRLRDEKLAILLPYLHVLEMVDGVQILLSEAAPIPARLQLRSAFEAILAIEFITETDTTRRAFAFLVADIRQRLAAYRAMDPKTPEGKRQLKRIQSDVFARLMKIPEVRDLDERLKSLEGLLQKPNWKEANEQYNAVQKRSDRRPEWYHLCDPNPPGSIEDLASRVKRGGQYEILYRQASGTVHGGDAIRRQLTKGASGGPVVSGLRDTDELAMTIGFAATLAIGATRKVLLFFRPEEAGGLAKWYLEEVREPLFRATGWDDPHMNLNL